MMVRRSGVFVAGALLLAACSSGSDAEPAPLETPPPVTTATPSTDGTPESTTPSTEVTAEVSETTTEPEPATTEASEPIESDGPVEVFREAAVAFNAVQLNPTDESIQPAAYDLMTERFRADRSFEVATGDPEFLDPWKDLVVLSRAEVDESGEVAFIWYCQRELEPDPDSGIDVSAVWQATMESADGQWRWADRSLLGRSDSEPGCPDDSDAAAPVADEVRSEVEDAAIGYFDALRLAVEDPRNSDLVDDLNARSGETVRQQDDQLLAQTIELEFEVLQDPSAPTEAVPLGVLAGSGDDVTAFVCQPDNTKVVAPGQDPDSQPVINRSIVWEMTFSSSGTDWIATDRQLIVDWQFEGMCIPS